MPHIKQKNSSELEGYTYTVVIDNGNLLGQHPAVLEEPNLFEVVDQDIPEDAQYLKYTG